MGDEGTERGRNCGSAFYIKENGGEGKSQLRVIKEKT